jgi:hypothetical protein
MGIAGMLVATLLASTISRLGGAIFMHSKTKKFLGGTLIALLFLFGVSVSIDAQVKGAIFTTNAGGTFVNANVYSAPEEPYLNGGPRPNAPCTAAGLPDGDYYFQVTNPSGSMKLSSDDISERKVHVASGIITSYLGTTINRTSTGQCGDVTVRLYPYDTTPNPGGEYKVWMTPVDYYDATETQGSFGFLPRYSKTDNFKVINETGGGEGDSDGDGIPDDLDGCPEVPFGCEGG